MKDSTEEVQGEEMSLPDIEAEARVKADRASLVRIERMMHTEMDTQVATAKQFPRSIQTFKQTAMSMATLDEETAEECFYTIPRGGKMIEGPSVRLAEIVSSAWGHLRVASSIVREDDHFIYAMGQCWDLQTNVARTAEVRRRITDKNGRKFSDDMIAVTANAACAIAARNAVFTVIPRAYIRAVYNAAKECAVGTAETLASKRDKMFGWFRRFNVTDKDILAVLEKKGVDDIDLEDLGKLKGIATAIKDGEVSVETAFGRPAADTAAQVPDGGQAASAAGQGSTPPPAAQGQKKPFGY